MCRVSMCVTVRPCLSPPAVVRPPPVAAAAPPSRARNVAPPRPAPARSHPTPCCRCGHRYDTKSCGWSERGWAWSEQMQGHGR